MYRNIYEYGLDNQHLWGTETLLGDWDGHYLLIAKDFYPSSYIEEAIRNGEQQPYRHNPNAPTNRHLLKTLRHFKRYGDEASNTTCDFLYISACFLLRADGKKRGPLPNKAAVLKLSEPVVEFTIRHMANLKCVVLMGKEALQSVAHMPILSTLPSSKGIQLHHVSHPSRALSDVNRFTEWQPVFDGGVSQTIVTVPVPRTLSTRQPARYSTKTKRPQERVLECLSPTPQSVGNLMARTGLGETEVRSAIDRLRLRLCVWHDTRQKGFWIDQPASTDLPSDPPRWKRIATRGRPGIAPT